MWREGKDEDGQERTLTKRTTKTEKTTAAQSNGGQTRTEPMISTT
jgi:hypothetical protein